MIEKLRKKFINITMIAVISVLVLILVLVNSINYINTINRIDFNVNGFIYNNQKMHMDYIVIENGQIKYNDNIKNMDDFKYNDMRYNDNLLSEDEIEDLVDKIDNEEGYIGDYKYIQYENKLYIFDIFVEMNSFRSFLYISSIIIVLSIIWIYVLVLFFSKKTIKPIERNYEKQKQFITNVSHEFKTPLSVILTNLEVLEVENGENEWSESIKNQIKTLTNMTNDMISLSRLDESEVKLSFEKLSIRNVIDETIEKYKQILKTKDLNVIIKGDDINILGDKSNVKKISDILIDNAIKYSNNNEDILISFEDNKMIISNKSIIKLPKGNLNMVFDRFYRLDESRNSNIKGSGIGLSIVNSIIEKHKWNIKAYSLDEETFNIEIKFK